MSMFIPGSLSQQQQECTKIDERLMLYIEASRRRMHGKQQDGHNGAVTKYEGSTPPLLSCCCCFWCFSLRKGSQTVLEVVAKYF